MVSSTPSSVPRALRPHKEFLIAWVLMLLDAGELHGYRLHRELLARGVDLQPTSLYRWLARFERDGWVASSWSDSVDAPRRHVYVLTAEGRSRLHDITRLIAATRDTYSVFLRAHEQAVASRADEPGDVGEGAAPPDTPTATRDAEDGSPAAPSAPQSLRPHKELLAGWLLLHLDSGATYGYDLRRELSAHQLSPDPGTVYRMLRRLEADKWVQSRWMSPAAGPRRRFYRLTTRGRRNLDEIARLIAAIRDSHDRYLQAYEHGDHGHLVTTHNDEA